MGLWGVIGSVVGNAIAPGIGGVIGGALGGAADQSGASGDASRAVQQGNDAAIAEQRRQYDLTRADYAPWRAAGLRALPMLESGIGQMPTAQEVMADPGYQFGLAQGQQAIDRKIAAGGGRMSGAAIKAAGRFGTDYASTGYNAAYQRRQDRLNRLAALAGIGQSATGASAEAGQQSTNAISGLIANTGRTRGAAALARGSIWGDAANQIGAQFARNPNALSDLTKRIGSAWETPPYWGDLSGYNYGGGM